MRYLILGLKSNAQYQNARLLGSLLAEQLIQTPLPDSIIPVPLHPNRYKLDFVHFYMAHNGKNEKIRGYSTRTLKPHANVTRFRYNIFINFCAIVFSASLETSPSINHWQHFVSRSSNGNSDLENNGTRSRNLVLQVPSRTQPRQMVRIARSKDFIGVVGVSAHHGGIANRHCGR
jgi:hypothetical protein